MPILLLIIAYYLWFHNKISEFTVVCCTPGTRTASRKQWPRPSTRARTGISSIWWSRWWAVIWLPSPATPAPWYRIYASIISQPTRMHPPLPPTTTPSSLFCVKVCTLRARGISMWRTTSLLSSMLLITRSGAWAYPLRQRKHRNNTYPCWRINWPNCRNNSKLKNSPLIKNNKMNRSNKYRS